MCGIVGYVGDRDVKEVLLDGLAKLEYRGYDSAGIALKTENDLNIYKENGKLEKLTKKVEKVNLKGGPKVENNMYGTFLGGDSDLIELGHGWDMVYSAYASYDGSHQNYDGVSIYQNGGHLGGTAVFYKDNFFTGLTANVGASVAEARAQIKNNLFLFIVVVMNVKCLWSCYVLTFNSLFLWSCLWESVVSSATE